MLLEDVMLLEEKKVEGGIAHHTRYEILISHYEKAQA